MHILFYIDPLVERERPFWKTAWIQYVKRMVDRLRQSGVPNECMAAIVPDAFDVEAREILSDIFIGTIAQSSFVPSLGADALSVAIARYKNSFTGNSLDSLGKNIKNAIPGFTPNIAISFSPAPELNSAWSNLPVIHWEYGIFSRRPFPETVYADPCGMFQGSALGKFRAQIRSWKADDEALQLLDAIRDRYQLIFFTDTNPVQQALAQRLSKFPRVALLALQFSDFYAYDAHATYRTQFDLLIATLEAAPQDMAILAIEHPEHLIFDIKTFNYLQQKYPNLIWDPVLREVYAASQYAIACVDTVITVSSSIGWQAALWRKRLIIVGSSHLDLLADSNTLDDLASQPLPTQSHDDVLAWLLSRYYMPWETLFEGRNFFNYLDRVVQSKPECIKFEWFMPIAPYDKLRHVYCREMDANILPMNTRNTAYRSADEIDKIHVKLYFAAQNEIFSESQSLSQFVKFDTPEIKVVSIEEQFKNARKLRFDPCETSDSILLHYIVFTDEFENILCEWDGTPDGDISPELTIIARPNNIGWYLICPLADPWIEFNLPPNTHAIKYSIQRATPQNFAEIMNTNNTNNKMTTMFIETITERDQTIAERDRMIVGYGQAITQRDAVILEYSQKSTKREAVILEYSQKLTELETIILERDDTIVAIKKSNYDKEIHIGNIERALRAGEETINNHILEKSEIYKSSSWRLTAPIRFLGHQILRFKTIFKGLPYAVTMCNGYRGLFEHVWQTYKSEGFEGVKLRILFSAAPGATPAVIDYAQSNKKDYKEWILRYDTFNETDRIKIKNRISNLSNPPLISVIMPVYNAPLNMLEDAIRSVQGQLYPNWELCIADDASTNPAVHTLIRRYTENDVRIKVIFREENGHISAASNSALELATGKYIALMDNDDLLPEHALFWIADTITQNPEASLIYSDEDKVDEAGRRYDPYFKSDWNPDLFLSHNMICHLGVYRTDLVKEIGGFREGYEGAQDYDLALRCIEKLTPKQIVHIPRVLYHWRSHSGSTAQAGSEKSYALPAGARALNDHFDRIQVTAKTELLNFGMYRTSYAIPIDAPLVSLIIPTRNGLDLVKQCVESILTKTNYKNYEILIVDNNSDDPKALEYFANLTKDSRFRILRDERPFNYSALNNAAVQQARGEYIGLINNDIEVITPEWLDEMMGIALQPGVGAVGARLWYPNDTLQHGGVITGIGGIAGHAHKHLTKGGFGYFSRAQLTQTFSVVTAACLIVKKSIFLEVGELDEINLKVGFNDVDFCLRVREAGYRNVWTPYAELYHHESATRGYEDTPEKQARFTDEVLYMKKRWGEALTHDPAYSPNLTLDHEDFSYAWPPRVNPI